jgi:hypothetical protein
VSNLKQRRAASEKNAGKFVKSKTLQNSLQRIKLISARYQLVASFFLAGSKFLHLFACDLPVFSRRRRHHCQQQEKFLSKFSSRFVSLSLSVPPCLEFLNFFTQRKMC